MFKALKKMLGIRRADHDTKCIDALLFSGSAYFSNRVPNAFTEKWAAHGGEVSSGTTLDVRARYFFAMDPSDPWVTKLFAKSIMVIHAGWITHCVDEAFHVPIAEYILDDRFIPGLPYKLTTDASGVYAPLSEPYSPIDSESGEHGPVLVQISDTPSTPTSMPRKRKREQAYFDSPSGSLVFSGFDKDGLPRRPRKLRKLRFDPSFSPEGGRSGKEAMRRAGLYWLGDHHHDSRSDDEFSEGHGQRGEARVLSLGHTTPVRAPDTPDTPVVYGGLTDILLEPAPLSSPVVSTDLQKKAPPVRTIDFTNLPQPTRRWRFPDGAGATRSRRTDMLLSITKDTDHKVKTPKKISFADHARICVYTVSPRQSDAPDGTGAGLAQQRLGEESEDGPGVNDETRKSNDQVEVQNHSGAAEATNDLVPQTCSLGIDNGSSRRVQVGGDQFKHDTLTLTVEDVEAVRQRLLESAATHGVDDGQLAAMFELGKTFRGVAFRHVW